MTPSSSDEEKSNPDCYHFDQHCLEDCDCDRRIVDTTSIVGRSNKDHVPRSFGPESELMGNITCLVDYTFYYLACGSLTQTLDNVL